MHENNDSNVKWQTVFWIISTLAVNNMLQDTGKIFYRYPSKYRFVLHSMPFVCLADTLLVIYSFAQALSSDHSLRRAIQAVAELRRDDDDDDDAAPALRTEEPPMSLWRIGALSVVGFLALVQFTKLCALRGVPWTQAFGASFFASYLVQGALNLTHYLPRSTNYPLGSRVVRNHKLDHWMAKVAMLLQVLLWAKVCSDFGSEIPDGQMRFQVTFIVFIYTETYLHLYLPLPEISGVSDDILNPEFALVLSTMGIRIYSAFSGVWYFSPSHDVYMRLSLEYLSGFPVLLVLLLGLMVCSKVLIKIFVLITKPQSVGSDSTNEVQFSMSLLSLNLGLTIYYYAALYHPQGTYRPAWLDKLP